MFYLIKEMLQPCSLEELQKGGCQYVAVLTPGEWQETADSFDMFIDLDLDAQDDQESRVMVNYDSLTGTLVVPDREKISEVSHHFAFALDEKGIVLICATDYAERLVDKVMKTRRWKLPSLERFIYDLLELIINRDLQLLSRIEQELNQTEEAILRGEIEQYPARLNALKGDLLDLRLHYEQLIDIGQELEENENGFFKAENLRYFHLFTSRVQRLSESVYVLRDYISQLRDLMQSELSVRQNHIMTLLTVITAIFMPLTLIAGWYGMNFRYMPELEWRYSYLVVFIVCLLIAGGSLWYFKKKKWL